MINFIKDTFKTLNLTFLIRNYFFGILIYCLFMYLSLYDQSGQIKQPIHYGNIAYFTIFVGLIGILLLWIYRKRMINNDSN